MSLKRDLELQLERLKGRRDMIDLQIDDVACALAAAPPEDDPAMPDGPDPKRSADAKARWAKRKAAKTQPAANGAGIDQQ